MYRLLIFVCLITLVQPSAAQTSPRNILQQQLAAGGISAFAGVPQWRQQQREKIRAAIVALPDATIKALQADADKAMAYEWPSLRASVFLEYRDNGNRSRYESVAGERRKTISRLIAGELAGGQGKYLPQIANGLWLLLEESTWVLPAHMSYQRAGIELPDPAEQVIDLGAGETAALLSWAQLLLEDQLQRYSPMLPKRIHHELDRRIIRPFLEREDFWWMGFKGGMVNNWNIWVNTNVLLTTLLTVNDTAIRHQVITKTIRSADNFLNAYPEDGGCDEGPTYWGHAGGKLIEYLELLKGASQGKLQWTGYPLIHRIGAYIYKMHIDSSRFVNFADALAVTVPPPHAVYAFGEMYHDAKLKSFAAYLYRISHPAEEQMKVSGLPLFVQEVMFRQPLLATAAVAPYTPENWLPDLQVLSLRSKGLYFAAQGGHNAESHNHNDVGNFVLYMNGQPAIIDAGVGTYTKQTFSKDRYQLWNMQSQWHNCPDINGVMQKEGRQFKAKGVRYRSGALEMDIAGAYPAEAAVTRWQRRFIFNAARRTLQLEDRYELRAFKEPSRQHLMTALPVDTSVAGKIVLQGSEAKLVIYYDPALLQISTEQREMDDPRLGNIWGPKLTRITLTAVSNSLQGRQVLRFEMK